MHAHIKDLDEIAAVDSSVNVMSQGVYQICQTTICRCQLNMYCTVDYGF